jgi:hypothetical protein
MINIIDADGLSFNFLQSPESGFAADCVMPLETRSIVITINGNSDGRTHVAQRVIPSKQAEIYF